MRLSIGFFIMGLLSACSSRPLTDNDHACIYSKDMGRYGDMTFEQKMELPIWVKACN